MQTDERCCGTGTCLIDAQGKCWCGQQWNGTEMCLPERPVTVAALPDTAPLQTVPSLDTPDLQP